jgi:thiol-disulfide isomerase/thioredoxin
MQMLTQKWSSWLRDIAIGAVLIGLVFYWQSQDMVETDGSIAIANTRLPVLSGETDFLFVQGKQTLVYFFAPWCQVCHLSIGNLDYLDESNVNIVRIALDYESANSVTQFAQQHNISSDIFLGNESIKQTFKVTAYPTYYLLDTEQNIIGGSKGYSTAVGLKLREYLLSQ